MPKKLLLLVLLLTQTTMAARVFHATMFPLSYAAVVVTNVGDVAQHVKITFKAAGGGWVAKHTGFQDPAPVTMPCTSAAPYICAMSDFFNLAPGKNLSVSVQSSFGTPPLSPEVALNYDIEVSESAGAIIAFSQVQYMYNTAGGVFINLPMPIPVNAGRPF